MRYVLLLSLSIALAPAAEAQEGSVGIAFAIAPEQSNAVCIGRSATATLDCARARCAAGGARPADCQRTTWCYPAGWSATFSLMHREGPHWTELTCGWPSRAAAEEAVALSCRERESLVECGLAELRDPEGNTVPSAQ
jgi:hypothetical protein